MNILVWYLTLTSYEDSFQSFFSSANKTIGFSRNLIESYEKISTNNL